jgi:hypothetical protein
MLALIAFGNCIQRIDMAFEEFLDSGLFSGHAKAAMCTPEELVLDHLPVFDPDDEDETQEAFREACEQATDGEATRVRLDRDDLRFVRSRLVARESLCIPFGQPLGAA